MAFPVGPGSAPTSKGLFSTVFVVPILVVLRILSSVVGSWT